MRQFGIFDEEIVLERLSKLGDPLEQLDKIMDWGIFIPTMDEIRPDRTQEGLGGRPPYPNLFVFKSIVLRSLNGISFEQMEFFVNDRLSWKRFLGLSFDEKSPDSNAFRTWEEIVTNSGRYSELFEIFNKKLEEIGVIAKKGSLIDSTFVDVPRQRI